MGPKTPRSLVDSPPGDMVPKDSEALVAIGRLQVTCQNQEIKLQEQGEDIAYLKKVISTANGARLAFFWIGAFAVGAATFYYSVVNSFPWHKGPG